MSLTGGQDDAIAISMRVCGAISLVGCLFIVLTFVFSKRFRRPVNRLIFYASWGNIVLAVMSILSVDPIFPPYGPGSSLCTAQGFMIQMFLPSDALWNLAMAINVYLTIFKRWEVERMKRLEIFYASFNFGAPFIIAFAYLFINDSERGRIYGPASIWCWITTEWDWLRIALLYAPSWICIIVIFVIYAAAGLYIYEKRRGLNSARNTPPSFKRSFNRSSFIQLRGNSPKSSSNPNPFTNATKTTEIKVTSERAPPSVHELAELGTNITTKASQESDSVEGGIVAPVRPQIAIEPSAPARAYEPYTVTINGGRDADRAPASPTFDGARGGDEETLDDDILEDDLLPPTLACRPSISRHLSSAFSRSALPHHQHHDRTSADPTTGSTTLNSRSRSRAGEAQRRQTAAAQRQHTRVAWGYTKVALLYFLSLLSTWVPSSVNRVYSLVHESEVNYGLSMAAAFVLPLVGFWNALIYAVTSWDAVRETWWEVVDWASGQKRGRKRERSGDGMGEAGVQRRGPDGRW